MTLKCTYDYVDLRWEGPVAEIRLNRPERHNALIPDLLESLLAACQAVRRNPDCRILVLAAEGSSFSTGGDIRAFYDAGENIQSYAKQIVGLLNDCMLALFDMPMPVIGRIQGPVTGGSLGLLLACDMVAFSEEAFIQPYYSEVGFAPDGGWAAILPKRIGPRQTAQIMMLNHRIQAAEALELGLASQICKEGELDGCIKIWISKLMDKVPHGLTAAKESIWTRPQRATTAIALEEELIRFTDYVNRPETWDGMRRFLGINADEKRGLAV